MTRKIAVFALLSVPALPWIHPFGQVRNQHSTAPLPGMPNIERACQNCHSERTQWPLYSNLPVASWLIEKDVADGRSHMNLSHWSSYSDDQKRDLLARIGAEVRSRQMPPARYLKLHPDAQLSDSDIDSIYRWTKAQRANLRKRE